MRNVTSSRITVLPFMLLAIGLAVFAGIQRGGFPGIGAEVSPSPSVEPSTTPELPAGLENRSWVAGLGWNGDTTVYGAATLDGKASLLLPPSELGLTADDGRVVSMGSGESGGSVLRVRDIASGNTLLEISRPEQVEIAVLRGDSLFFTGLLTPVPTDPGVYRADLAGGPLTTLIESGPWLPEWDYSWSHAGRTVELSPSGRTLASGLCAGERCRIDVIDLTSGDTRLGVVEVDGFLRDITDSVAIAGSQWEIAGYDLTTGAKLWSFAPGEIQDGYMTTDGRLVQGYNAWVPAGGDTYTGPTYTVATINVISGDVRVLFEDPDQGLAPRLWPEVSGDRFAVLGRDGRMGSFFDFFGGGAAVAITDLLDLETGELIRGRLVINQPNGPGGEG